MRMDTTNMIVTFRNFVKLPKNTATYTTILPPLGLVEGKCVFDNFLFPKFHSSKFKIFLFSAQILRLNFMPNFQKLFKTFSKKYFDECIVICWWNLRVALKQGNMASTVWYKGKIANVVSNSGTK